MKVEFYCSSSGNSPILKFIDKQAKRDQAVILRVLKEIEDHDFNAKGATFRQLEGKLWEIKINTPSGGYRFVYVTIEKELLFILHAFMKKTQKTPLNELKVARKRLREVL